MTLKGGVEEAEAALEMRFYKSDMSARSGNSSIEYISPMANLCL